MKRRKKIRQADKDYKKNKKNKSFFSKFKFSKKSKTEGKLHKGKMSVHSKGFGFCELFDQDMEDVFISATNLNGAFNGDEVEIVIFDNKSHKSREGKVVNILSRGVKLIVGNYLEFKDGGYVEPDMKKLVNKDIFIPQNKNMGAVQGEKVVVRIVDYGDEKTIPVGEVIEVIKDMDKKGNDIIAIIRNYELYEEFPMDVVEEAKKINQQVSDLDLKGRLDFRGELMCTIDGEDARDFDDAVSIKKLANGGYELGVHIADVGHYVKKGSLLDKEAYNRGTSVYFPDMVLPMLPKELSNGICSLNPREDRLTISVIAKLDENANVVEHKICESVINSNERMTYTDVFAVLSGVEKTRNKYSNLVESFELMAELSKKLEDKREKRGALDFNLPETYVKVDENGKTIDIAKRERDASHKLIESFMVLANEIVAEEFNTLNLPFVYRVHEKPTLEKMTNFFDFANAMSIEHNNLIDYANIKPKDLQEVIKNAEGTPFSKTISEVMLRSLQKAKYFQKCLGHFGLASKYYCHFTSPIRRYPDLVIHRIIKAKLNGKLDASAIYELTEFVMDASNRSSEKERLAEKAERDVVAYKKCEYMQQFIGEEFDGNVTGVNPNGIFVGLPNTVEGFVNIGGLPDDYYELDEKMFTLVGRQHKFMIGQDVKVKLVAVNLQDRRIDFDLVF